MRSLLLLALSLVASSLFAADHAWIEYGPNGPLARAIVRGDCPAITIDGRSYPMRTHAAPGPLYPVTTCQHEIPSGARSASIDDKALPVHKLGRIAKVVIVGDTGCRRKYQSPIQDCSDPNAWPFATVAASIAKWDPDLIIHTGDYYYRESTTCTATTCSKSLTYDWPRWNADFFTPAASVLRSAPWIFSRGNHEDCNRAAEGFFRFLDPRPYVWENTRTCLSNTDFTPPYTISLGGRDFIAFDSSAADSGAADPKQLPYYTAQLTLLGTTARPGSWLVLHHPFWALVGTTAMTNTLMTAWQQTPKPPSLGLMLGSHIHLLEALTFQDGPPQVVVGNGGTSLDTMGSTSPVGQSIGGRTISNFYLDDDFGFIAAVPKDGGAWTFTIMDKNGTAKATCELAGGSVICR